MELLNHLLISCYFQRLVPNKAIRFVSMQGGEQFLRSAVRERQKGRDRGPFVFAPKVSAYDRTPSPTPDRLWLEKDGGKKRHVQGS